MLVGGKLSKRTQSANPHPPFDYFSASVQVDDMKEKLAAQEIELGEKNAAANALIERVGIETASENKEKEAAAVEQAKVALVEKEVGKKAADCAADLAKASTFPFAFTFTLTSSID